MSLIWLLESLLLGCLLVCRFTDLPAIRPLWPRLLMIGGAGAAGGIGLTSCIFFLVGVLLGMPAAAMAAELVLLAWAGYQVFRHPAPLFRAGKDTCRPILPVLTAASLLLAFAIGGSTMWTAWEANPHGNWDAWAIWNLRAAFLDSDGGLAQRAWSPVLGASTHPEYPLLLSSFVGRCQSFGHSRTAPVPAATSFVFFLALIALAAGAVAVRCGPTLGCLMALALLASPSLLHEVPAQYADVPLACYISAALVFVLLDRPVLAGIFAGFAAWTKDEGLLFLILFLAATAAFKRRSTLAVIAGAAPAAAIVAFFKTVLAAGDGSLLSASRGGALQRVADLGRYGAVATAFAHEFLSMATGWFHPVLPLLVLAVVLKPDSERRSEVAFCGAVSAALLLGYAAVYILTPNDLAWQLQTSLGRLMVQVWPALLLTGFLGLRAPEAFACVKPAPSAKVSRKARG